MAERLASATGSLADGVERLDRLIRGVKDRQFSEALNAPAPKSVSNAFVMSPEEAWSKKFMTAGIGPSEIKPVQMPVVPVMTAPLPTAPAPLKPAPKALEPAITVQTQPQTQARAPASALQAQPPAMTPKKTALAPQIAPGATKPAPIGQVLAKPARKPSWFGRLVRGN
jgi:hypothetical protein